jgi:hypothetical protein
MRSKSNPTASRNGRSRLIENLETRRLLATFVVDSTGDVSDDMDGALTLREAIEAANLTPEADTINFGGPAFAGPATIFLEQGQIIVGDDLLASDITINDTVAGVTIDGNAGGRHFGIDGDTTDDMIVDPVSSLTLNGLTLTGGATGIVANDEFDPMLPVSADNPEFVRASGGSVFVENAATFTANGTSFLGNVAGDGGAIVTLGNVVLNDVVGNDNVADDVDGSANGGFLFAVADATVAINGGSFDNNSALANALGTGIGGFIRADIDGYVIDGATVTNSSAVFGGALFSFAEDIDILNSTFDDNNAEVYGGVLYQITSTGLLATLEVNNSSFTGNTAEVGGAFFTESDVSVSNSAFTANEAIFVQASADQNFATGDGAAIYQNFRFGNGLATTLELVNTVFDSNVSGLAGDNEGDGGATYLDAREPAPPSAFSRGLNTPSLEVTPEAINAGLNPMARQLQAIDKTAEAGRGLGLNGSAALVLLDPDITVDNVTYVGNIATGAGGGMFLIGDGDETMAISGSTYDGNEGQGSGGGIFSASIGDVTIDESRFVGNLASGNAAGGGSGGGALFGNADLYIRNSEFSENDARNSFAPLDPITFDGEGGFGGALNVQASGVQQTFEFQLLQSTISSNFSDFRSGISLATFFAIGDSGISSINSLIQQSTVVFNDSGSDAIFFQTAADADSDSSFSINNSILAGNTGRTDPDPEVDSNGDMDPANDFTEVVPANFGFSTGDFNDFDNAFSTGDSILGSDIQFDFDPMVDEDMDGDPTNDFEPGPLSTDSPMLGALGFNGGSTRNHVPLADSLAIDNGTNEEAVNPGPDNIIGTADDTPLVFDQRRTPFDRIFDDPADVEDIVDIGAVERSVAPPTVLSSTFDGDSLEVTFVFDQDVGASLTGSDLIVFNDTTGQQIDSSLVTVDYDPLTDTATFDLAPLVQAGLLTNGNYTLTLDAASVENASSVSLETDEVLTGPDVFFLAGDADGTRSVVLNDFTILRNNFGGTGGLLSVGDFDLDGDIDLNDFTILRNNFGASVLPPASSVFADEELFA